MRHEDLTDALRGLGTTEEAVARTLQAAGARGVRGSNDDDPLCAWLARKFPGHSFRTDWLRVEIDGEGRCVLPEPVGDCLIGFDKGEWPGLERAEKGGAG